MGLDGQSQSLLSALQSMSANPPEYMAGMNQNRSVPGARSLNPSNGTDSSLSNSPYTSSPSLISPMYDPATGPPLPYGTQSASQIPVQHQTLHPRQHAGEYWSTSSSMPPPSTVNQMEYNQQDYGSQSFPPPTPHQQHHQYQGLAQTTSYPPNQDMGYTPQPPQRQGNTPTGRYVFQPDGSQIYIPYDQE